MSEHPYPGLRAFRRDETDIFFGREQHTDALLDKLQRTHFLAVLGPSGYGKSSLVRTGMLSALAAGFMRDAQGRWAIADMQPRGDPFGNLSRALLLDPIFKQTYCDTLPAGTIGHAHLEAALRRGPLSLHDVMQRTPLPQDVHLLLLVDQFEELFRYEREVSRDEVAAFIALLLEARRHTQVFITITMRSDFLGPCAAFAGLAEAINDGLFLTPRLTRSQLADAIRLPARGFDGQVKDDLTNRLLNDCGAATDQLPLMQHALMRLWDADQDKILTLGEYLALGGLTESLSRHADEVLGGLSAEDQRIAEILFRRLTEGLSNDRDTRKPAPLATVAKLVDADGAAHDLPADAPPSKEAVEKVIRVTEAFRGPGRHFLTPTREKEAAQTDEERLTIESVIDISHEALIRQWGTLKKWTHDELARADLYRRLERAALEEGELWRGRDAKRALQWKKDTRPTPVWAQRYGDHYEKARGFLERTIWRRRTIQGVACVLGLSVLAAGGWGVWFQLGRMHDRDVARQSIAIGLARGDDPATATESERRVLAGLQLVLPALSQGDEPSPEAANAFRAAVQDAHLGLDDHSGAQSKDVALSHDGKYLATVDEKGAVHLWDASTGLRSATQSPQGGARTTGPVLSFTADDATLVAAATDGALLSWPVSVGGAPERRELQREESIAGFTPSGDVLVRRRVSEGKGGSTSVVTVRSLRSLPTTAAGANAAADSGGPGSPDTGSCNHWASLTREETRMPGQRQQRAIPLAVSSDGLLLARGANTVVVRSATSDEEKCIQPEEARLNITDALVTALSFVHGDRVLAVGTSDGRILLWELANATPIGTLNGHHSSISRLAYSERGGRLVSLDDAGEVHLWRLDDEHRIFPESKGYLDGGRPAGGAKWHAAVSNDLSAAALLLTPGKDLPARHGTVPRLRLVKAAVGPVLRPEKEPLEASEQPSGKLWTDVDGQVALTLPAPPGTRELGVVRGSAPSARGAKHGVRLALVTENLAIIQDPLSGKLAAPLLPRQVGGALAVAQDSHRAELAVASWDGTIAIWDADGRARRRVLFADAGVVWDLAYSPDGSLLAAACQQNLVRVWNTADWTLRTSLSHAGDVRAVAFSPDGRFLATASWDKTARIWEVASWMSQAELTHPKPVNSVQFDAAGKRLVTASNDGVHLWSVASHKELRAFALRKSARQAVFGPREQAILAVGVDRHAHLWDIATGRQQDLGTSPGSLWSVAISRDGQQVAAGDALGNVTIWRLAGTAAPPVVIPVSRARVNRVLFLNDGALLTAGEDRTVRIWALNEPKPAVRATLKADPPIESAILSPDARHLAVLDRNGLEVWAVPITGQLVYQYKKPVRHVAFDRSGSALALVGTDGSVSWVDVRQGKVKWPLPVSQPKEIARTTRSVLRPRTFAVFDADSQYLLTAGSDMPFTLWTAEGARRVLRRDPLAGTAAVALGVGAQVLATIDDGGRLTVFRVGSILTPAATVTIEHRSARIDDYALSMSRRDGRDVLRVGQRGRSNLEVEVIEVPLTSFMTATVQGLVPNAFESLSGSQFQATAAALRGNDPPGYAELSKLVETAVAARGPATQRQPSPSAIAGRSQSGP